MVLCNHRVVGLCCGSFGGEITEVNSFAIYLDDCSPWLRNCSWAEIDTFEFTVDYSVVAMPSASMLGALLASKNSKIFTPVIEIVVIHVVGKQLITDNQPKYEPGQLNRLAFDLGSGSERPVKGALSDSEAFVLEHELEILVVHLCPEAICQRQLGVVTTVSIAIHVNRISDTNVVECWILAKCEGLTQQC